jgi:hypothetical protein
MTSEGARRLAALGLCAAMFVAAAWAAGKTETRARVPEWDWFAGDVFRGTRAAHTFHIENEGPGVLEVLYVHNVLDDKDWVESFDRFIKPGGRGHVRVYAKTENFPPGPFMVHFAVITNPPVSPRPLLRIHGMARPGIQVFPTTENVNFYSDRGFAAERFFILHAEGHPGFKVLDVETTLPLLWDAETLQKTRLVETKFAQKPEAWARKGDVVLRFRTDPDVSIVGRFLDRDIVIRTDIPTLPEFRFKASAHIRE